MALISGETISKVRERVDMVNVIGGYVRLSPSGNSYKALCPFHEEKTPSFFVVPDKQIYHCFGCGKGGDIFTFLMEIENISFVEAVKFLADQVGVEIEADGQEFSKNDPLYVMAAKASELYRKEFLRGGVAMSYLEARGISLETAETFEIGYAPDSWDFLLKKLGKTENDRTIMEAAWLLRKRTDSSGYYDAFRNRLMVPIKDIHGRYVAFGGRVLTKDNEPKYLNSGETDIFNKRKMLFNFRLALPAIRRMNSAIVVEGYMDAITLWQYGFKNVTATLGTAISSFQMSLLARNCQNVYFCYDADEAGQRATLRAISLQKDMPLNARVICFDNKEDDPDSFLRREGAEKFRNLLDKAKDIYTFLIDSKTEGLTFPLEIQIKERLLREFKEIFPAFPTALARSEIIKKISALLDIDQGILRKELGGQVSSISMGKTLKKLSKQGADGTVKRQEWILMHLLEQPGEIDRVKAMLLPEDFSDELLRKIYLAMTAHQEMSGGSMRPAEILASLDESELVSRLSELITKLENRPEEPMEECIKGLIKTRLNNELELLQRSISEAEAAGNDAAAAEKSMRMLSLKRKLEILNEHN